MALRAEKEARLIRLQKEARLRELQRQAAGPKADQPSTTEIIETAVRSAAEGATAGISEPAISAARAAEPGRVAGGILGRTTGLPFTREAALSPAEAGQVMATERAREQARFAEDVARRRALQAKLPAVDIGGQIAGAISPVGPAAAAFRAGSAAGGLVKGGGALARLGGGALAGAGGTVAEEAVRKAALQPSGFVKPGEEPGLGELAGTGAVAGAAGPALKLGLRGARKAGFLGLGALTGVPTKASEEFIQSAERIKTNLTEEEIKDIASRSLEEIQKEAIETNKNVASEILFSLDNMKRRAGETKNQALDILARSDVKLPSKKLVGIAKSVKANLPKIGGEFSSDAAESAAGSIDKVVDRWQKFDDEVTGGDIRAIIQGLDSQIDFMGRAGQFDSSLSNKALKEIRYRINQELRKEAPEEFTELMNKNSNLARLIDEGSKKLGDTDKARRAVGQLNLQGKTIKDDLLKQVAKEGNVDLDRIRKVQEEADLLKGWNQGNVENKILSLTDLKAKKMRQALGVLSQRSEEDLVQAVNDLNIRKAFEKEYTRGSRNVFIWTAIGAVGSGGTAGTLLGTALGALIDKKGPKFARGVLEGISKIQGIPTIQKINRLDVPPGVKEELRNSFVRAVVTGKRGDKRIFIPPEQRPDLISEIESHSGLSDVEKAEMLSDLSVRGEVKNLQKIVLSGEKPTLEPETYEERKPQAPVDMRKATEFIRSQRRPEF